MARLAAAAWLLLVCVSTTHAGGLQFPLTSGNELWSSIVGKRTDKSGCNGCQLSNMVTHCPLDVVFLLDGSDSIPPLAYQKAVDYVIKEIETVTSLFPGSDVGVLIFSKVVEKEFELRQRSQSDLNQLYQSIRATKQPRKGSLLTDVMREARRLLERYDAAPLVLGSKRGKMIVLVSDGCLDGVEATLDEGRLSAKQGIYILSVATSQAYMSLLTALSVQVLEQRTAIDWRSIVACPTKVLPPVPASSACDDFVLVMDGSDSVRSWEGVMRDYMAVTSLRFQNVDNSIGVIVFGTNVTAQSSDTMLPLLKNKVRLAEMIENKLRFPHSGGTGTTAAIQAAVQLLSNTYSTRRKTIIIVTDGPALNPINAREALATAVRQGIQVVVVGVGDAITRDELQALAGFNSRVEQVSSYLDLYGLDISSSVCNNQVTPSCSYPLVYDSFTSSCRCSLTSASCSSRQRFNSVTCTCECATYVPCASGQSFNDTSCQCEPVCPPFTIYDSLTLTCRTLRTCNPPQVLNTVTDSCECPRSVTSCPSSQRFDSNTCACVNICSPPLIYNTVSRSCQQCTPPLSYDYATQSCGCSSNSVSCLSSQRLDTTTCTCVPRCSAPQVYNSISGLCRPCDPPLAYDYGTQSCRCLLNSASCLPSQRLDTTTCSCVCSISSASCLASQQFNSANCTCVSLCSPPLVYNQNTRSCYCPVQSCPSGQVFDSQNCQCNPCPVRSCSVDQTWNSQSCQCVARCLSTQTYDLSSGRCICTPQSCPYDQTWNTQTCQCVARCTSPLTYDQTTGRCRCSVQSCPSGQVVDSSLCRCVPCPVRTCSYDQTWNAETCQCVARCTSPKTYEVATGRCVCQARTCAQGQRQNSDNCLCEVCPVSSCPFGQRWNAQNCQCEQPPCNPPYTYNSFTGTCQCQRTCLSSEVLNTADCSCEPLCTSPLTYDSTTRSCRCTRTSSSCLSSQRFNSTTCNCDQVCIPPQVYNSNSGLCVCPIQSCSSNLVWDTQLCRCVPCTPPLTYDPATRSCQCRTPMFLDPTTSTCQCPTTMFLDPTTSTCQCVSPLFLDPTTLTCRQLTPTCNPPLVYNNSSRACEPCLPPLTYDYVSRSCQCYRTCSAGETLNTNLCSCESTCRLTQASCSTGYTFNATSCSCQPICRQTVRCDAGSYFDETRCTCVANCRQTQAGCQFGYVLNLVTCVCEPSCASSSVNCVYGTRRSQPSSSGECCDCQYGFTGAQCNICDTRLLRCQNGGTPSQSPVNGQCVCICPPYCSGPTCSNRTCDPSSARCVYGNVRSSPTTSGDCCDCNYGFTGSQCDRCDTQIARCLNGGTPNTYPTSGQCGCSCPPGYTGTNCEQQVCDSRTVRCVYGNVRTTPTASGDCCDCNYGFTGSQCDLCDTRINRCQNGGTPNAFLTSGQCGCTCLPGYTGTYCEQRRCNTPCVYGTVDPTTCQCVCYPNFVLNDCSQCDIFSMNCQNGGYPAVQNNQCACTCPAGFTGSRCEQCSTQPNICQNGGTVNLIPINGQCGCRCLAGYTGLYCETALCSSNTITCENGGTPYLNTNNGQCACSCLAGFSGPTCGRGLCTLPCGPNSSPDRLDNLCTRCVCNPGWTGLYCNTPVTVSPPTTSTELCSASESPCLNGQPAYRDCNGRCICRCDSRFYTGPNCEYRVEPKLCDNCLFQNGNYLAPVQGRCDLFVVCQPTNEEQTEFIPWVQSCPAGTMFQTKGSVMGCIGFGEGVCSSDPCQTLGVGGRYAHATECARYYECSNQVTAASQCCPAGQSFDARTQQCVNNPSCVNTCAGTYRPCDTTIIGRAGTEEFCPYRARPNNESFYYHLKAEAFSYPCGLQRIFNSTSCLCQDDPRAGCGPTIDLPFDTSSPNKSVPLRTVAGSHGRAGYFDGTSRVVIYRYSNSGFYTDYFLMQFRVKPTSVAALGAGEVALVSNGDCGVTESLGITLSSNYVSFKVQQEGSSRLEVLRVPYSPSSDWLDIKFVYERLGDGLYSFTGTVNGQSQSLEMTSVIATRACALHIAQGQNYRNLDGYVDDFQIWMCKPSTVFG